MAVGMFSMFEAVLQDRLECRDGFVDARMYLDGELKKRFAYFVHGINVLKHGYGKSYDALVAEPVLPFRLKRPGESFFFEGDVSEISTLIQVDDQFVLGCAALVQEVTAAIDRSTSTDH